MCINALRLGTGQPNLVNLCTCLENSSRVEKAQSLAPALDLHFPTPVPTTMTGLFLALQTVPPPYPTQPRIENQSLDPPTPQQACQPSLPQFHLPFPQHNLLRSCSCKCVHHQNPIYDHTTYSKPNNSRLSPGNACTYPQKYAQFL